MIEKTIDQKLQQHRISSGDNLLGFQMDVEAYLYDSGMFEEVDVKRTDDPRCALHATCSTAQADLPDKAIEAEMERIWSERLRYGHWEEHELKSTQTGVSFRFITTTSDEASALCVTGRIEVRRRG